MSIRSTTGGYNRTKKLTRRARLVGLSRSNSRWHLFSTATAMFSVAFLVTFLCSSILAPARNTNAETVTESSSASGYTLSLSATPVVNLNVGVLEVPAMTVGVGTVSTSTTAPNGYKLYLSMAGTSNDLRRTGSDVDTISATTGTMADSSALGIGEWGYAIPSTTPNISATDFDTSYDIMESAYPSSKGFAAPPVSTATAQLVTSTEGPNEKDGDNPIPDDIDVYYGINADNVTPLGTYTNSVLFTAIADAASTPGMTVSPTTGNPSGGDTITVASTLFASGTVSADVYMLTNSAYADVSTTPSNISSYSSMKMTCSQTSSTPVTYSCTTPANAVGNDYHVYMNVPRYDKRYNADFEYKHTFWSISNMQEMTPEICASVTAPTSASITTIADTKAKYDAAASGSVVPQRTLTDPRGATPYKTYRVRKLADGRCWMVDNLRLVGPISASDLNSANTNVASDSTFALTASNSGTWCTTNESACDDQSMVLDSGNADYGAYYNWYAATAGTGKYGTTTDTSYSICPKGWRLPKGGSSGEFQTLYDEYKGSSDTESSTNMRNINGPNFILAGYRFGGSTGYAGTLGYYWSSTARDGNSAYNLMLFGSSYVGPADNAGKYYGSTVRCIADEPFNPQLTVNPNGGTWEGSTSSQTFTQDFNTTKTISNPTSTPSYSVSYNGNGQGASYTDTSGSFAAVFDKWDLDGGGYISGNTYTFGPTPGTLTAKYAVSVTLPTITKSSSACVWAKDSASGEQYGGGTVLSISSDTTFYAVCNTATNIPSFYTISNMQQMTASVCNSVTTPSASATSDDRLGLHLNDNSYVPTTALVDTRGSTPYKAYTVRKLADGRCWMTDNLALVGASGGTTLTPADSNVSSNYTLPAQTTTFSTSCTNTGQNMTIDNASYPGAYYNWSAATAGTGTCSMTSGNATSSICPKGWRLPKGGDSGEFQVLRNVYSSSAFGNDWRNTPLNFTIAGGRFGSSTGNVGMNGYYWSSTAYNNNYAHTLILSSSNVVPADYSGKDIGFTVRCINAN